MYLLHYAPDNASLIVRLVLEEMGLAYKTSLVDRARRAQDSAAYRRLHPNGLIPVLETPDGPIFETAAIVLWLSESQNTLAPAPGTSERAPFLKWLFFTSNSFHADIRLHFYPDQHAGSSEAVPAFAATTRNRITHHLQSLETMAAERPSWCSPDTPSVMTYYLSCLLRWLALYPKTAAGWFDLSGYPALFELANAMEMRPAAINAALAEGLGHTIFTAPTYAAPPEGSAT
ncbi:MAG: glutathione S-transferase family protein [Albidovulum sp.]